MNEVALVIPLDTENQERVYLPTELQKAEHLKQAQGKSNAKGTVPPKAPGEGSNPAGTQRLGSGKPESSKSGSSNKDISKRGGHKKVYDNYKTGVSGERSNAVDNYLKLTNTKTGKVRKLKLGTANKAKFDHAGNCVRVTIDGKKYPVQNHLVKLPRGVYHYSGMVSVAAKVMNNS